MLVLSCKDEYALMFELSLNKCQISFDPKQPTFQQLCYIESLNNCDHEAMENYKVRVVLTSVLMWEREVEFWGLLNIYDGQKMGRGI